MRRFVVNRFADWLIYPTIGLFCGWLLVQFLEVAFS